MSIVLGVMRASKSWTVGSDEGLFSSQGSAKVSEVVTFEQNEGREQVKWVSLEEKSGRGNGMWKGGGKELSEL